MVGRTVIMGGVVGIERPNNVNSTQYLQRFDARKVLLNVISVNGIEINIYECLYCIGLLIVMSDF